MPYIFCSADKLEGLSFNGGLMFVGLVQISYDWRDLIKCIKNVLVRIEQF